MAIASGIRVGLSYIAEVTAGTTPASPTFKVLRTTTRAPNVERNLIESQEVASHAQDVEVRPGFERITGSFGAEMITDVYNDWLAAVMGTAWSTASTTSGIVVDATNPATVTRLSGSFVTDGLKVGSMVTLSGFAAAGNNGTFMVLTVAALTLTLIVPAATPLTTEVDGLISGPGKYLDVGTTQTTFSMERSFPDISAYQPFLGVTPMSLNVTNQPEQMVGLTFNLIGLKGGAMTATTASTGGTPTAAGTGSPYDSLAGLLGINGSGIAAVTGLNFTLDTQRNVQPVIGSYFSPEIFEGKRMITGEATMMFQDRAHYNLFYNKTICTIGMPLMDPNGTNYQGWYMPRVRFLNAPMDPGQVGPVIITLPFRAFYDSTLATSLRWFRNTTG